MTQQNLNFGIGPNTYTGDNLDVAMTKVQANFTDLYSGSGQANNGGVLKSLLIGSFTFSSGTVSKTVVVNGMLATDVFKFFPAPGNTEAWNAWREIQISSQTIVGGACDVVLILPSAPSTDLVYNYEVAI